MAEMAYLSIAVSVLAFGSFRYTGIGQPQVEDVMLEVPEDPVCTNLENWIVENGGKITGARCVFTPEGGGRGLKAAEAMTYRQTYIEVPRKCWMNEGTMKADSAVGEILTNDPVVAKECGQEWGKNGEPCRLALAMMFEEGLGEESFWHPYFASIPAEQTSPLLWTQEEIAQLESEVMIEFIMFLQGYLKKTYRNTVPHLIKTYPEYFSSEKHTLDALVRTTLMIWGRSFDSNAKDATNPAKRTWSMIPFADLVNHQSYVESFFSDRDGSDQFACWATECFTPGAEIFQSYGSHKPTAHFFYYYGFVPGGYLSNDYISFEIAVPGDAVLADKTVLREGNTLLGFAGIDGRITESFLTGYRDVLRHNGAIPVTDSSDGMSVTLYKVKSALEAKLYSLNTTYQEDLDKLAEGFTDFTSFTTLSIRTRYKFVMQKVLRNLEHRIASMPTSTDGWKYEAMDWTYPYDDDEFIHGRLITNVRDSMFKMKLPTRNVDYTGVIKSIPQGFKQ
eukprot:gene11528-21737_t